MFPYFLRELGVLKFIGIPENIKIEEPYNTAFG
jgi:hypothetical protein